MKFTIATPLIAAATAVGAMPSGQTAAMSEAVSYPAPESLTVAQASDKCGSNLELKCCNKHIKAGDTSTINKGILAGVLQSLAGSGSSAEGIQLFGECSKLPLSIPVGLDGLLAKQCQQNVACCDHIDNKASGLVGVGIACLPIANVI
ncbi:hypothetical protein BDW74DRAFT_183825 [Aspergillus multicolor]|uniref:hydrophobin family protein n=1 Tax=Aspergillus multicolor TaxID=41759 RepID=UPI003CCD4B14